jgi:predicted transcriptional regulator
MRNIKQLYAFVIASKMRVKVLKALEKKPLRPKEITDKIKDWQPYVSKTLFQLEKKELVECLTPDKKAWRVYAITDLGKEVLNFV